MKDLSNYLDILKSLRNDWSDEIPEEILHSYSPGLYHPKFKARRGWFCSIIGRVKAGVIHGFIDPNSDSYRLYEEFCKCIDNPEFKSRDAKKEDIEIGNDVLDRIIRDLESRADSA